MMLIIGRAIAGIGGSGLMNGGFTIIAVVSPQEKRPRKRYIPFYFVHNGLTYT
jgi:MFS family permease